MVFPLHQSSALAVEPQRDHLSNDNRSFCFGCFLCCQCACKHAIDLIKSPYVAGLSFSAIPQGILWWVAGIKEVYCSTASTPNVSPRAMGFRPFASSPSGITSQTTTEAFCFGCFVYVVSVKSKPSDKVCSC